MHPLDKFTHCPICGSRRFEINDEKSKRCSNCGFAYYLNPSASNAALIVNDNDELLVVTRKKEPCKGQLDLPGGFYDIGETAEQGVAREVKEETGLTVAHSRFLYGYPNTYLYSGFTVYTLDLFFYCEVKDFTTLAAHDDAASFRWIPIRQLQPELFAFASIRKAVKRFMNEYRQYDQ